MRVKRNGYSGRGIFFHLLMIGLISACHDQADYDARAYCDKHYKAESYQVALKECTRVAEQGYLTAQWRLSLMYSKGQGVEKDLESAFYWSKKAAQNAHTEAQRETGRSYLQGRGVAIDIPQGKHWLSLAARGGDSEAKHLLGRVYLGVFGGEVDQASAFNWFKKAVSDDFKPATIDLAWLLSTSKNDSLRRGVHAEKLIQTFVKRHPQKSGYLKVLAAAYAEQSQFQKAIETQELAIQYLSENEQLSVNKHSSEDEMPLKEDLLKQLEMYQQKKPWRE